MQTPSLGLMSLFGVEPNLATTGLNGFAEEGGHDFSALFNLLLDPSLAGEQPQTLPLDLQGMAEKVQQLPLDELTPEQTESLNTLLAQLNMGELQLLPLKAEHMELEGDKDSLLAEYIVDTQAEELVLPTHGISTDTVSTQAQALTQVQVGNELVGSAPETPRAALVQSTASVQVTAQSMPSTAPDTFKDSSTQAASSLLSGDVEVTEESAEESFLTLTKSATSTAKPTTISTSISSAQVHNPTSTAELVNNSSLHTAVAASNISQHSADLAVNPATVHSAATAAELEQMRTTVMQQRMELGQDTRQWGGALSSRVVTMIAEDVQQARIFLDPPELGSLEIKLQIQHQQAVVQVQTQHAQVRDVLETHAHRLREALAEQGIELSEFDVSSQGQQHAQSDQQEDSQAQTALMAEGHDGSGTGSDWQVQDETMTPETAKTHSINLLDVFA